MSSEANKVRRKLSKLRRNIRWMFVAHGMAHVTLAIALALIWHYVTDTFIEPPVWVRVGMLGVVGLVVLFVTLRRVIYPLTRRLGEQELALLVENEYPLLNDRLITALQLARDARRYEGIASASMMNQVISEGLDVASRLRFKEVVQSGKLLMATGLAIGALAGLSGLIFADLDHAELWVKRLQLQDVEYPRQTQLDLIVPMDLAEYPPSAGEVLNLNLVWDSDLRIARCARGSSLRVIAKPHGNRIPERARIYLQAIDDEGKPISDPEAYDMDVEREDGESERINYYHFNLSTVPNESTYRVTVEAGDADESFTIVPVRSPALDGKPSVSYQYPEYMRKADVSNKQTYELAGPNGTQVEMTFETERPLAKRPGSARIMIYPPGRGRVEVIAARPLDDSFQRFGLSFELKSSMIEYALMLEDDSGLRNMNDYRSPVRVEVDVNPEANIRYAGESFDNAAKVPVTLAAVIPMQFTLADTYGIKSRDLRYELELSDGSGEGSMATGAIRQFSQAFEARQMISDQMDRLFEEYVSFLTESSKQYQQGAKQDGSYMVERIARLNTQLDDTINRLREFESSEVMPLSDAQNTTWRAYVESWDSSSAFLASPSAEEFESGMTAAAVQQASDRLKSTRTAWQRYREILNTGLAKGEEQLYEFHLPVAWIYASLASNPFSSEEALAEAIQRSQTPNAGMELSLWLEAKDNNAQAISNQNVGRSPTVDFELVTQDQMKSRISQYIRERLRSDLQDIVNAQSEQLKLIDGFLKDQTTLNFDAGEKGAESRKTLTSSQLLQSGIPESVKRLEDRFAKVGHAYTMNNLEREAPNMLGDDRQADRIHISRIALAILITKRSVGDRIKPTIAAAQEAYDPDSRLEPPQEVQRSLREMLSLLGMWRPAGEDLLNAPASVKRIRNALPLAFDVKPLVRALGMNKEFTDASSLPQLDELYKNVLNTSLSLESRRDDLAKIREKQQQTMAGLKIVEQQLKKWEGFDSIVQELKFLRDLAQQNADDIKRKARE